MKEGNWRKWILKPKNLPPYFGVLEDRAGHRSLMFCLTHIYWDPLMNEPAAQSIAVHKLYSIQRRPCSCGAHIISGKKKENIIK